MVVFTYCNNHPARGGSHASRALYVKQYFNHPAILVMCTYRSKKGHICGDMYMVLEDAKR